MTAIAVRRRPRKPFGPFDGQHSARGQLGVEADVVEIGTIEAVQIDVHQRQASAAVFVHERERRAGHFIWIDAEPAGKASHEDGLAGSEIARQQDDGARRQRRAQARRDQARFVFGAVVT